MKQYYIVSTGPTMSDSRESKDEMHSQVDWLKPSDYTIVSEISEYGGWIKPASLTLNIPFTREHVARRCKALAENGLLERHEETPAYRLTDQGRAYLAGELEVDALKMEESK